MNKLEINFFKVIMQDKDGKPSNLLKLTRVIKKLTRQPIKIRKQNSCNG